MAERNAAQEGRDVAQKFEAELNIIKREIQNLFNKLHELLDERKDALLTELMQINTIQENNKEAECAIHQLESAMEGLVSTISSNLLREKKDHYSESLTRDIAEYRDKIRVVPNIATGTVLHNRWKFNEAMKSIEVKYERVLTQDEPKLLAVKQGDRGNLKRPRGISVCPTTNTIFITDRYNNCVKSFSMEGAFLHEIGDLNSPWSVAVCDDALYVTDVGPKQITKFRLSGELLKKSGGKGQREGEFANPRGLCATQEAVYVCDQGNNRVQVLTPDLDYITAISHPALKSPVDIHVKYDDLTVLPLNDNTVYVFKVGGGLQRVTKLDDQHIVREKYFFTIDNRGCFIISSRLDACLKVYSPDGRFQNTMGRGWAEDCYGVCMTGNGEGLVCVCNNVNGRLQIY